MLLHISITILQYKAGQATDENMAHAYFIMGN